MSNFEEGEKHCGLAALSICESLLLALVDRKIFDANEICDILKDAAATHRSALGTPEELEGHRAVAAIIERVMAGRHLARRW